MFCCVFNDHLQFEEVMQGKIIIIFLCVCLALLTGKQSKCFAQIVQFTHVREQRDADIQGYPNKMNSKTPKSDHLKSRWDDNMWDYPIATAKDYPRVTKNLREKKGYLGFNFYEFYWKQQYGVFRVENRYEIDGLYYVNDGQYVSII